MDTGVTQAIGWLYTSIHIVFALALLVVALVRLRTAHPAGAYLIAASAGVEVLGSCCNRVVSTWIRSQMLTGGGSSVDTMFTASSALALLISIVSGGLLVAGLAVAGRGLTPRSAS